MTHSCSACFSHIHMSSPKITFCWPEGEKSTLEVFRICLLVFPKKSEKQKIQTLTVQMLTFPHIDYQNEEKKKSDVKRLSCNCRILAPAGLPLPDLPNILSIILPNVYTEWVFLLYYLATLVISKGFCICFTNA